MSNLGQIAPMPGRVPVTEVQGTLALELQPRQSPPTVIARGSAMAADVVPIDRAQRRALDAWVGRFAQAAVEVVGGDRPVTQLLRWTSEEVYAELDRRAVLIGRAGRHQPGQGRVQPVRPRVASVHSFFVTATVAESSIHVRYGARSRALAARFEGIAGRWVCAALEWA